MNTLDGAQDVFSGVSLQSGQFCKSQDQDGAVSAMHLVKISVCKISIFHTVVLKSGQEFLCFGRATVVASLLQTI